MNGTLNTAYLYLRGHTVYVDYSLFFYTCYYILQGWKLNLFQHPVISHLKDYSGN